MNRWAYYLSALPATLQRAIARAQRISLPRHCSGDERVLRLRQALCRQATVRMQYAFLSAEEQAAAVWLGTQRYSIRPHDLTHQLGTIRPWKQLLSDPQPRSMAERFLLLGWLLPRPAAPHNPAGFVVPPELRRSLPQPHALLGEPRTLPAAVRLAPVVVLANDLLFALAQQPLAVDRTGRLCAAAWRRLTQLPRSDKHAGQFTLDLLIEHGCVVLQQQQATLSSLGRRWLDQPVALRQQQLRDAWITLPHADRWAKPLLANDRGMHWPAFRQRLLHWATQIPPDRWFAPDALFAALVAAEGPLATAHTHGFRQVQQSPWRTARSAAIWQAAVQGPLTWLGLVERDPEAPNRVCRPSAQVDEQADLGQAWQYGEDNSVWMSDSAPSSDLLRIAPYLRGVERHHQRVRYQVSERPYQTDQRAEPFALVRSILAQRAGQPPEGWGTGFLADRPIQLRSVVLLQADPDDLRVALRDRQLRRATLEQLAPGLAIVAPEQRSKAIRALNQLGYSINEASADAYDPTIPPLPESWTINERITLLLACAAYRQSGLAREDLSALEARLRVGLPEQLLQTLDQQLLADGLGVFPRQTALPWSPDLDVIESRSLAQDAQLRATLRRAIQRQAILTIRYSNQEGHLTERRIRPLDLYQNQHIWYLSAYCIASEATRTFRLDRIRECWLQSRLDDQAISATSSRS
jgi:hypothetical protein